MAMLGAASISGVPALGRLQNILEFFHCLLNREICSACR